MKGEMKERGNEKWKLSNIALYNNHRIMDSRKIKINK